jgi:hypothetical protein
MVTVAEGRYPLAMLTVRAVTKFHSGSPSRYAARRTGGGYCSRGALRKLPGCSISLGLSAIGTA